MLNDDFAVEQKTVTSLELALILSKLCLPLMIVQAIIGLFVPGSYMKDGTSGRAIWLGTDFVNLFLFTPLLFIAIILVAPEGTAGNCQARGIVA